MNARAVLRAHQTRSVGHGQRYVVEREWLADGRVMQRVNEGKPILENEAIEAARWSDLEKERARARAEGWALE